MSKEHKKNLSEGLALHRVSRIPGMDVSDQVVKDEPTRDRTAREEGTLCFEIEAAGLMETFPCVVMLSESRGTTTASDVTVDLFSMCATRMSRSFLRMLMKLSS